MLNLKAANIKGFIVINIHNANYYSAKIYNQQTVSSEVVTRANLTVVVIEQNWVIKIIPGLCFICKCLI